MIEKDAPTSHLLSKSRATATKALALSAGGFVLVLLVTAPLREEPGFVLWSYVSLLVVFGVCLRIRQSHPTWAGALVCLGPFVLITGLVALRGGVTNPPALLAYLTLVVLAALCWGSKGAFVLSALGSVAIGAFAAAGPRLAGMGPVQTWAESSFQLVVVAYVTAVLLRAVDRAALQALRLEAEKHEAHLARLALEARVLESRSLEVVGRLAGGIAHDFNNLLTVILSRSECALRSPGLDSPAREDVLGIEEAALRASKLTGQLLAVGRRQVLSPIVLCPAETVRDLEPLIRRLIPATTELRLELAPDTGRIRVDEARLEQILLNLVTNANAAVQDEGVVTIVTKNTVIARGQASSPSDIPEGDYVETSVRDSGPGMSAEVTRRIFEPFFTTDQIGIGMGLGLATVLGIVQQSGGHVDVESEPGKGSLFRVLMPRTSQLTATRPTSKRALSNTSVRILLVEDEDFVRAATRRLLESLGHGVTDVPSGQVALDTLTQSGQDFDILISDVIMPGLTGPALAERVWQVKPNLKVLFISGYPADQLPLSGGLPSQSQYLSKPFGRAELSAKLAEMLGAKTEC